jgi:hypothetical protein
MSVEIRKPVLHREKTIQMKKVNCWEFKQCGREPGGINVAEFGVCQAATEGNGGYANGGDHGGRFCWALTGTFCKGEV